MTPKLEMFLALLVGAGCYLWGLYDERQRKQREARAALAALPALRYGKDYLIPGKS